MINKLGTEFYQANLEKSNDRNYVVIIDNGGGSILIDNVKQIGELRILLNELENQWIHKIK